MRDSTVLLVLVLVAIGMAFVCMLVCGFCNGYCYYGRQNQREIVYVVRRRPPTQFQTRTKVASPVKMLTPIFKAISPIQETTIIQKNYDVDYDVVEVASPIVETKRRGRKKTAPEEIVEEHVVYQTIEMTTLEEKDVDTSNAELLVVFGATGNQGGNVVKQALKHPERFKIRAISRDPDAEKAKWLRDDPRIEVVDGDYDDEPSINNAIKGASMVFFVTDFWDHLNAEKELKQIETFAETCEVQASIGKLRHVVFSTWEDMEDVPYENKSELPGLPDMVTPHMSCKGKGKKFFLDADVPTTFLHTSFFYENFINMKKLGPQRGEDGTYKLLLPIGDSTLPMVSLSDLARAAVECFLNPEKYLEHNAQVGVSSQALTGEEMAATFAEVCGIDCKFSSPSRDEYAGFGFPGAEMIANMFEMQRTNSGVFNIMRVGRNNVLNRKGVFFKDWMKDNKEALGFGQTLIL